jgi:hypothetical protein
MESELNLTSISVLLTEELLLNAIKKCYCKSYSDIQSVENIKYTVNYASNKGDGYMGVVYRINIELLNGNKSLNIIAKGMPQNIVRRKTFECERFFEKEVYFYNKIVPTFHEFELKYNNSNSLLQIPDCYYAYSDGKNDFLLLEDLIETGYDMFNRLNGLDNKETKEILKVLAKFHAFSYAMKALEPENFKKISQLKEPYFSPDQEKRIGQYSYNLARLYYRAVEDELKNTEYLIKYENFIKNKEILYKNQMKLVEIKEPAVLTHSDIWLTNVMYKNINNEIHIKIIDHQMTRYGSPIIDISSLVFNCLTSQQRNNMGGVTNILQIYHTELENAMKQLGAPQNAIISLQELFEHWKSVGAIGFVYAMELVPLSLVECDQVQDLDRVEGENAIPLEDLTQFSDITDIQGKKRLVDLLKLAVDEGMI